MFSCRQTAVPLDLPFLDHRTSMMAISHVLFPQEGHRISTPELIAIQCLVKHTSPGQISSSLCHQRSVISTSALIQINIEN